MVLVYNRVETILNHRVAALKLVEIFAEAHLSELKTGITEHVALGTHKRVLNVTQGPLVLLTILLCEFVCYSGWLGLYKPTQLLTRLNILHVQNLGVNSDSSMLMWVARFFVKVLIFSPDDFFRVDTV